MGVVWKFTNNSIWFHVRFFSGLRWCQKFRLFTGKCHFIKENLIGSDKETQNCSRKVPLNTICNSWRTSKSKETSIYMAENTESIWNFIFFDLHQKSNCGAKTRMLKTTALCKFYLIVIQINCDDGGIKLLYCYYYKTLACERESVSAGYTLISRAKF